MNMMSTHTLILNGLAWILMGEIKLIPHVGWRMIGDFMASNPPLIFIHGIKGCELIGATGTKKWLRIRDILYSKDTSMSLPISWDGGIQSNTSDRSGKPISSLAGKSIYGKFLNGLKKNSWTVHSLSLIHIWRCRRIERCRSRWSPYH